MNHQDIADRREALRNEKSRALEAEEARIAKEVASLQELCGGMGHVYVKQTDIFIIDKLNPDGTLLPRARVCAACEKNES